MFFFISSFVKECSGPEEQYLIPERENTSGSRGVFLTGLGVIGQVYLLLLEDVKLLANF